MLRYLPALSPAERVRLAAAARAGTLLASQEEIELAASFARRDRRRRRPARLISAFDIPVGIVLILGGLVAHAAVFIAIGASSSSACSASAVPGGSAAVSARRSLATAVN